MDVTQGDSISLRCKTLGERSEQPFTWRREGFPFQDGRHRFQGDQYDIRNATRNDAGTYYCTATAAKGENVFVSS